MSDLVNKYLYRGPDELIPRDAVELRTHARDRAEAVNDAKSWIELCSASLTLQELPQMLHAAERAIKVAPDDVEAIWWMAESVYQAPGRIGDARYWYEKVWKIKPDDLSVLQSKFKYALLSKEYEEALNALNKFEEVHPGHPINSARIARVQRLLGDHAGAKVSSAKAASLCTNETERFPYGRAASLRPVYRALAGDLEGADADSLEICVHHDTGLADPDHPRYPIGWLDQLAQLQINAKGRDLYIIGNGPSLSEIVARRAEIKSLDFLSMTMTSFEIARDDLLRPIGKDVDFVCMTHSLSVQDHRENLEEWLNNRAEATLLLPLWIRELDNLHALIGDSNLLRSKQTFWFDCYGDHLPHPGEPLHVPNLNTLLCALSVGTLFSPRRIFLFGFDGQIKGNDPQKSEALYYKEFHDAYKETRRDISSVRESISSWLRWDTTQFDELAPHTLRHMALLFDLPLPPVYNVCADSAIRSFPRISFDRFLEIVK